MKNKNRWVDEEVLKSKKRIKTFKGIGFVVEVIFEC